jgi:DNA-binding response OmpR family regulator/HPt (histidine-containing phosphotransfer) domain-containing protein
MGQVAPELRDLWSAHKAEVDANVAKIEDAVGDLMADALGDGARDVARGAAHQLAGTVGTYGFVDGSAHALALERALEQPPVREEAPRLAALVAALRGALADEAELPVTDADAVPLREGPAILVVCADRLRGEALAAEARRRGLAPIVAGDPIAARRATEAVPAPQFVVLDPGDAGWLADALALGGDLAGRRDGPLAVILADERTDRVEVARHRCAVLPRHGSPEAIFDGLFTLRDARPRTRQTILAIDDDPALLDAVHALLGSGDGSVVASTTDPAALWEALEQHQPDLLLLDVDMPGMTGIELCRAVRGDLRWAALPVVFLTGRRDAATINAVFEAGADDLVNKPIVAAELRVRIANRLERTRLQQALSEIDPATSAANRGTGVSQANRLIALAASQRQPLAIAIASVNPPPGLGELERGPATEQVLRAAVVALRGALRAEDVVARWDDRRLLVALYGLNAAQARRRVGEALDTAPGTHAGVAGYPAEGEDLDALCRSAARALDHPGEADADPTAVDVVVIEDDVVLSDLLAQALELRGYSCRVIADGEEAVQALAGSQSTLTAPLVLLDWDLPGRNGLSVLRELGRAGVLHQTRVIMLTLHSGETETLEALKLGAFGHVAKPFSVPVLLERVRRALEG